ncbi:MAG: hypothetical protein WC466_06220 [Candidatus Izemoplasmatales bacterium]
MGKSLEKRIVKILAKEILKSDFFNKKISNIIKEMGQMEYIRKDHICHCNNLSGTIDVNNLQNYFTTSNSTGEGNKEKECYTVSELCEFLERNKEHIAIEHRQYFTKGNEPETANDTIFIQDYIVKNTKDIDLSRNRNSIITSFVLSSKKIVSKSNKINTIYEINNIRWFLKDQEQHFDKKIISEIEFVELAKTIIEIYFKYNFK